MGGMSRLLDKPIRAFTVYALLLLGCSIPAYYKVVDHIWLNELDEQNEIVRRNVESGLQRYGADNGQLDGVLELWCRIQPWTRITPVPSETATARDSVYTAMRPNHLDPDDREDRFRVLSSHIQANGRTYHVNVATNVEEADETILAIGAVAFIFFGLLVAGFIILNRRIAKATWRPFRKTIEHLKAFDLASRKAMPFEPTDIEEFEELHRVLQRLIERNISTYDQQRVFIENASHELQTPLAILKSKMELLLQNKDLTSDQAEILNAIEAPLTRMTRINKNLLLLAKIENSQFEGRERLDLSIVLEDCMALFADYMEEKALVPDVVSQGPLLVDSNRFLLETMVHNLLTNAIRHSPHRSHIGIELTRSSIMVSNPGAEGLDRSRLFERFSVSASESTSSGLGLAIVKEICQQNGWQAAYGFANGRHNFTVSF
jgi:signal transduction histidine kinase